MRPRSAKKKKRRKLKLQKEMEMVMPRAPTSPDFHFTHSTSPSPYATAPSSPKPFGNPDEYFYCYTSAPTSPTRGSAVYSYFTSDVEDWEEKTMSPNSGRNEFNFSLGLGGQDKEIIAADELFDKGQIKPMRPPQPRSGLPPKSPRGEEKVIEATKERGREKAQSRNRRETRSLSPNKETTSMPSNPPAASSAAAPIIKSSGSKKWRLKDLFLFRSASEGRATGRGSKDPLNKYTLLSASFSKGGDRDKKSSTSLKSMERKGSSVSAHELHYTANRAASEEKKKKTPLPYHRNTLFGCLHFNPAVKSITRGLNGNSFNQGRS